MKNKTVNLLPKTAREILNGGVYAQQVRCGKKNCKCSKGETHTAYYFFTYTGKKLRKIYVPKSKVKSLTTIARQAADQRQIERQLKKQFKETLQRSRRLLREIQQSIQEQKKEIRNG